MELFWQLIEFAEQTGDKSVGLFFSLLGALVFYIFRLRPKLKFGRAHNSRHVINTSDSPADNPDALLEIYNEQFFVSNEGRRPANNVSVVLSDFPRNISLNPPQKVSYDRLENGECLVNIPFVAAHELVTLDCVYLNQRAAFICSVRCNESVGKEVEFFTVQKYSIWIYRLLGLLMIFGVAFLIQVGLEVFTTPIP